ncbi:hypothetical protein CPLU01_02777 [Colletotrichum plurivorum]|uniref:Uncharacterized protein n=1 Tax=Colletotrichum plurivorum TaxID=2175906 RepID=A0A8H6KV74_9PEZI|nr:hypothetical protein CPLU01_02777 [Colletotrichum plurivorum]
MSVFKRNPRTNQTRILPPTCFAGQLCSAPLNRPSPIPTPHAASPREPIEPPPLRDPSRLTPIMSAGPLHSGRLRTTDTTRSPSPFRLVTVIAGLLDI